MFETVQVKNNPFIIIFIQLFVFFLEHKDECVIQTDEYFNGK